jgi:hypothetical protein
MKPKGFNTCFFTKLAHKMTALFEGTHSHFPGFKKVYLLVEKASDVRLGFCKVTPIAFFYKNIIFLLTKALKNDAEPARRVVI